MKTFFVSCLVFFSLGCKSGLDDSARAQEIPPNDLPEVVLAYEEAEFFADIGEWIKARVEIQSLDIPKDERVILMVHRGKVSVYPAGAWRTPMDATQKQKDKAKLKKENAWPRVLRLITASEILLKKYVKPFRINSGWIAGEHRKLGELLNNNLLQAHIKSKLTGPPEKREEKMADVKALLKKENLQEIIDRLKFYYPEKGRSKTRTSRPTAKN